MTLRWKPLRNRHSTDRRLSAASFSAADAISPKSSGGQQTARGWFLSGEYQLAKRWFVGARAESSDHADDGSKRDTGEAGDSDLLAERVLPGPRGAAAAALRGRHHRPTKRFSRSNSPSAPTAPILFEVIEMKRLSATPDARALRLSGSGQGPDRLVLAGFRLDRAGGRRRSCRDVCDRQGLPGPPLRRREALLHPEALPRRRPDRRRPGARDRLSAAAHRPGAQRQDPARLTRIPRRLDRLRHPPAPDHAGDASHGRCPSLRQSSLLDGPQQRKSHRPGGRRQAVGARPLRSGRLREEPRGLRKQAHGEGQGVVRQDGAVRRHEDRHVPRFLA